MSEEEINEELKADELKDVAGGVSGQVVNKSGVAGKPSEPVAFSPSVVGRVQEKSKGKIIPDVNKINPDAIRG